MLRILSVVAFIVMVVGIVWQFYAGALFGPSPAGIAVQVLAVALMLWARLTFGKRSFHAAANPTDGGIVTSGPYAFVRHPIYAAAIYFVWAGALQHRTAAAFGGASLVTIGGIMRMLLEERLLVSRYPAYRAYMGRVRRVVPFIV
ncbi:MAG TPA: isoprenylcysteine carboxylmethyltransferase family protein [Vicinamibacterales bacterium]|nr:isoprenylcysteine carboxylmethyltransferase family protein [Vicinamibacterales bacterium]